ncbi:MAG: FkbM family methyltransferase [Bacteroidetes bacterium]|nr:FkbM family methyltransferase [Bacteroidota bacterium]
MLSSFLKKLYGKIITLSVNKNKIKIGKEVLHIPDDCLWCFSNGDYYETNIIYWLEKLIDLNNKPVFYDIGASYGYYSVRFSHHCRQIYAFEPVSSTCKVLSKNIKKNKLKNVHIFKTGIYDKNEKLIINTYSCSANNSIFKRNIPEQHSLKIVGKETIRVNKLDDLFAAHNMLPPDIIKIDVEGAELSALKGAKHIINQYKPVLIIEYSDATCMDAGYNKEMIIGQIDNSYYSIYGIAEDVKDLQLVKFADFEKTSIANIVAVPKGIGGFEKPK